MVTPLRILLDGACPLCKREGSFLMRLDGGKGRLEMVDISKPGFDPSSVGVRASMSDVMGRIHAVRGDGTIVTGVEVFRQAYRAVGYGWMVNWTNWPVARPLTDAMYRLFARNRHLLKGKKCESGSCKV